MGTCQSIMDTEVVEFNPALDSIRDNDGGITHRSHLPFSSREDKFRFFENKPGTNTYDQMLLNAVISKNTLQIEESIRLGAKPNHKHRDHEGNTALHLLTGLVNFDRHDSSILKALFKKEYLGLRNDDGESIALYAARIGNLGVLKYIHSIAPEFIKDRKTDNSNLLHLAISSQSEYCIRFLLDVAPSLLVEINDAHDKPSNILARELVNKPNTGNYLNLSLLLADITALEEKESSTRNGRDSLYSF